MASHKGLTGTDIHVPYTYVYANATARNAATGFVSADVGKLARQTDDNSLWILTATTPTWVQVSGAHTHAESDVTSLVPDLAAKAPLASPTLTGTPAAPTASGGTNTTQIATTAFVQGEVATHEADTTSVHGITDTSTLYRAGGTDVALADGGTGASLTDPNADRILFWDDSAGQLTWLTAGTNLTITGTTIDASGGGGSALTVEEADGSPTDSAITKIIFPNGTLSIVSHEATYTPAAGGAPTTAPYITTAADAGLSAEIVIPGLAASGDISGAGGGGIGEEYDTGTTGLSWSPSSPATVDSNTTIKSHLYMESTDGTERFGTASWSPAGDFDIRCKITIGTSTSSVGSSGMLITDSGNTNRILFLFGGATAQATSPFQDSMIWVGQPYTYASGTYTQRVNSIRVPINTMYQRIQRQSGVIKWYASLDGVLWLYLGAFTFSITVANRGFRVSDNAVKAAVDWMRSDV